MSEWAEFNVPPTQKGYIVYGTVGLGLKSHPNDWWSGGVEPETPWLEVKRATIRLRDRSRRLGRSVHCFKQFTVSLIEIYQYR